MKKADERQPEHDRHEGPSSESTKDAAYAALPKGHANLHRHLPHASPAILKLNVSLHSDCSGRLSALGPFVSKLGYVGSEPSTTTVVYGVTSMVAG
jgi:hypothetical protein